MGSTDILLVAIFVVALLIGFFWGAMRSLLLLVVWLAAFLAGAWLRVAFGSFLNHSWVNFSPGFNEMAAFAIIFVGTMLVAPVLIYVGTSGDQSISRSQALNDIAGALLAFFVAVLAVAGTMVILSTFYAKPDVDTSGGPEWVRDLYGALKSSAIGTAIHERLIPVMGFLLKLVVPSSLSEFMK